MFLNFILYTSESEFPFIISLIFSFSSADMTSSASIKRIQSPLHFSSTEFFCGPYPFHFSTKTSAPLDFAISTVLSELSLSTTIISSAISLTESSVFPTLFSSLYVIIPTDNFIGFPLNFYFLPSCF